MSQYLDRLHEQGLGDLADKVRVSSPSQAIKLLRETLDKISRERQEFCRQHGGCIDRKFEFQETTVWLVLLEFNAKDAEDRLRALGLLPRLRASAGEG
jgi:hypothetical protein